MTCKEIAAKTGRSADAVRRAAKACGFELKRGKGVVSFNVKDTTRIEKQLKGG